MCARIVSLLWPRGMEYNDLVGFDFGGGKSERHLPIGSIGKGAEDLTYKTAAIVHKLHLETGTTAQFDRLRRSVFGFTSDQGVESSIADAPAILSEWADESSWIELMAKLRCRNARFDELAGSFLFPFCLGVADHCHMVFGALEHVCEASQQWLVLEQDLRALSALLRDNGLKMRYVETCVQERADKTLLMRWVGKQVSWKWEYLHRFLSRVSPLIPIPDSKL